jgi:hypothetical protein
LNRTKEEAEGTAARHPPQPLPPCPLRRFWHPRGHTRPHRRQTRPPQPSIWLTNVTNQILSIKNWLKTNIPIKSNPRLVISNNLHSRLIMFIDACTYISMFILLTAYSMAGQMLHAQRSNSWRVRHSALQ